MKKSRILIIDAVINLLLGLILIPFPLTVVRLLGVPMVDNFFYASILGGVLFGVGIALLVEYFRGPEGMVGLGIGGAISINLCGGVVLTGWLITSDLIMPLRGQIFLWTLVVILVGISGLELFVHLRRKPLKTNTNEEEMKCG